jgi:hypothetical protein
MAKQLSHIFHQNKYTKEAEQTKLLGHYEEADKAFQDEPYAKAYRGIFNTAKIYAMGYHIVSAALGLYCMYLLVKMFVNFEQAANTAEIVVFYTIASLVFALLIVVLIGIEVVKSRLFTTFFKNKLTAKPIKLSIVVGIFLVMAFSIVVSAIGGAIFAFKSSDKSTLINTKHNAQSDNLRNDYFANKKLFQTEIDRANSVLIARQKKSKMWGLTKEENQALIFNKQQLANLEARYEKKSDILRSENNKELFQNTTQNENSALISASVILLLELFLMWAYHAQWSYFFNVKTENANFSILKPQVIETPQADIIEQVFNKILPLLNQQNTGIQQIAIPTASNIGHRFGQSQSTDNKPKLEVQRIVTTGNRTCDHCGMLFTYSRKKPEDHRFCSTACRRENHSLKHGKITQEQRKIQKIG